MAIGHFLGLTIIFEFDPCPYWCLLSLSYSPTYLGGPIGNIGGRVSNIFSWGIIQLKLVYETEPDLHQWPAISPQASGFLRSTMDDGCTLKLFNFTWRRDIHVFVICLNPLSVSPAKRTCESFYQIYIKQKRASKPLSVLSFGKLRSLSQPFLYSHLQSTVSKSRTLLSVLSFL